MEHFQWVLKMHKISSDLSPVPLYLNAGIGKPWAGQERANIASSMTSKVFDLSFTLNFGIALPIGSTNQKHDLFKIQIKGSEIPECW